MNANTVKFGIALAIAASAGLVAFLTERGWEIGSVGEWIGGIGSILAAVVALWIADGQRRHATDQFREERDHAVAAVAEDRRYQEALAQMAEEDRQRRRREEDQQAAEWIMANLMPAFRVAHIFKSAIIETPKSHKILAKQGLVSAQFAYADSISSQIMPSTFHLSRLTRSTAGFCHDWNITRSIFQTLNGDVEWTEEQIASLAGSLDIHKALASYRYEVTSALSDERVDQDLVRELANSWADNVLN